MVQSPIPSEGTPFGMFGSGPFIIMPQAVKPKGVLSANAGGTYATSTYRDIFSAYGLNFASFFPSLKFIGVTSHYESGKGRKLRWETLGELVGATDCRLLGVLQGGLLDPTELRSRSY